MTDSSTALLLVRVGLSLGIVVGLILLASRVLRHRGGGRSTARRLGPSIEVVERRNVGKRSSVALLRIDDRRVLVGVTEHQVGLLADLGEVVELPTVGAIEVDAVAAGSPAPISTLTPSNDAIATTGTPAPSDGSGMLVADLTDPRFPLGTTPTRPPKLSLVQAVRELTVRRS